MCYLKNSTDEAISALLCCVQACIFTSHTTLHPINCIQLYEELCWLLEERVWRVSCLGNLIDRRIISFVSLIARSWSFPNVHQMVQYTIHIAHWGCFPTQMQLQLSLINWCHCGGFLVADSPSIQLKSRSKPLENLPPMKK